MYVRVPICLYVHHMHTKANRGQKRALDILELRVGYMVFWSSSKYS